MFLSMIASNISASPFLQPGNLGSPSHLIIFSVIPIGTFGYDDFTIDWYEVFMAWGLDLAELKQLAMNSILFSSMSEEEKQVNC